MNSIENHCRECLDDELLGATAQLFEQASERAAMNDPLVRERDRPEKPAARRGGKAARGAPALIEWLLCEEYAEARQLPEEQIAEYATEIVWLCIAVFRKEGGSSKVAS